MNTCRRWIAIVLAASLPTWVQAGDGREKERMPRVPSPERLESRQAAETSASLTAADRRFLDQALTEQLAAIELARLAQQRGERPLRQLGSELETTHKRAFTELVALSPEHQQRSPVASLDRAGRNMLAELGQLDDAQFERRLIEQLLETQRDQRELLQRVSRSDAHSSAIRTTAGVLLATTEQHLAQTEQLQQQGVLAAADEP